MPTILPRYQKATDIWIISSIAADSSVKLIQTQPIVTNIADGQPAMSHGGCYT